METEYFCNKCDLPKARSEMSDGRPGMVSLSTCWKCRGKKQAQWKRDHLDATLLQCARSRCKRDSLPYNLERSDIVVPALCPVLGIPLVGGKGKQHDGSPTLERLIPELGYVKGNVEVISYKANRMKNNSTLGELEALVGWLKQQPQIINAQEEVK